MDNVISVRVNNELLTVIDKLISLKIVKNKTEAVNFILNNGIANTRTTIQTKETAKKLLEKYLKEGLPDLPPGLSDKSIEERK
jgi:metal-responsive CopG/Arc/MetJ family transcriptional regulator